MSRIDLDSDLTDRGLSAVFAGFIAVLSLMNISAMGFVAEGKKEDEEVRKKRGFEEFMAYMNGFVGILGSLIIAGRVAFRFFKRAYDPSATMTCLADYFIVFMVALVIIYNSIIYIRTYASDDITSYQRENVIILNVLILLVCITIGVGFIVENNRKKQGASRLDYRREAAAMNISSGMGGGVAGGKSGSNLLNTSLYGGGQPGFATGFNSTHPTVSFG
jgi:hypothetical protein